MHDSALHMKCSQALLGALGWVKTGRPARFYSLPAIPVGGRQWERNIRVGMAVFGTAQTPKIGSTTAPSLWCRGCAGIPVEEAY